MVCAVPVEGHRHAVFDSVIGMVLDGYVPHFLLPESDPDLSLAQERQSVPLFLGRLEHVHVLRSDVGSQELEHRCPTATLLDDVV